MGSGSANIPNEQIDVLSFDKEPFADLRVVAL
jgi:hypothetical protein